VHKGLLKEPVLHSEPHGTRRPERVGENLNRALAAAVGQDWRVTLIGEDALGPYGGAFKISRGLSSRHPGSVLGTPISESQCSGQPPAWRCAASSRSSRSCLGDFLALGFDPILNSATKSAVTYEQQINSND
jgi:pyruvate dehydrogenase E1 component beta subunit